MEQGGGGSILNLFSSEEVALLRAAGQERKYPRGQIIFSALDAAAYVYYIEAGWVRIYRLGSEGQKVTVGSLREPGQMLGLAEALRGEARTCFAEAITEVSLLKIAVPAFRGLLLQHPALACKVAGLLAERMRAAEEMLHDLASLPVSGRLALFLLRAADRYGVPKNGATLIDLRLTHEDMASIIGTSRQTVTQTISAFKREKSVAVVERKILVLDRARLARWAQ